ncbi:Dabb family protein [Sphingomonas sp. KC8]|uniref:Dabb family protein n=1 Tax=Sphingomonas sp. KC8 TaxID=1030157 RepID=UPI0002489B8F|nr:Dabb family protein [Sphingomonas sp. KC8]ARS26135.1 stress protein [Sphingomonas sp. KC8]
MYNLLLVIGYTPETTAETRAAFAEALQSAGRALPDVRGLLVQPTLPGVYNGGDLLCRLVFDDAAACARAFATENWQTIEAQLADGTQVATLERVGYDGGLRGDTTDKAGIYRVALFCANVRPTAERLAAFGRQTASMPSYIKSIRRWQLSGATTASGTRPWTHVWEQEYENLDGLNGPYMMHPAHWAHVERWFDTEYTEHLVDPVLVHTFCAIDAAVIIG